MAASLELPVLLEDLLKTQQVQVIETIDAGNLKTLLKWIVDKLGQGGSVPAERFEDLEKKYSSLSEQLEKLAEGQAQLQHAAESKPELAGDALVERVQALEDRVKALEGLPLGEPAQATASTSGETPPISTKVVSDGAMGPAAAPQLSPTTLERLDPAAFEALSARVDDLEKKAGGAQSAHSGPGSDLSHVLAILDGKADAGELDGLRAALAAKADRAELDALASAGGVGMGADAGAATPVIAVGEDGAADMSALVDGVNRALGEVGSLRTLLVLLQQRVGSKADQAALDELRGKLAALSKGPTGASHDSFDRGLRELRARIEALELQLASLSAGRDADSGAAGTGAAAVDGVSNLEEALPLIRDLYDKVGVKADRAALDPLARRLAELGDALSALESRLGAMDGAAHEHGAGSGTGAVDPARVTDMETALADLDAAVRALQAGGAGGRQRPSLTGDGLESAVAALRDRLGSLEVSLAGKADAGALEEVKLRAALSGSGAPAGDGEGEGQGGLLDSLKDLLAGKANQAELDALKEALAAARSAADEARALADDAAATAALATPLAPAVDLSEVEAALAGKASRDMLESLAQQVGDLFLEVGGLRSSVAAGPQDPGLQVLLNSTKEAAAAAAQAAAPASSGHGHGPDTDAVMQLVNALAKELQAVKDNLDLVAHASNLMAVGVEQRTMTPGQGQGAAANGSAGGATANGAAPGLVNGREPRNPRGAMDRLAKLLGRQAVGHKMDWFDPDVLNKLATKMGSLDAMLKGPNGAAMLAGKGGLPEGALRDLELQLKRLARDVRGLKDKDGGASGFGAARIADGDHAMLSGKPLMGYRCMACDRPLDKLDERPGPHIPTYQMPISVPAAPDEKTKAAMTRASNAGGYLSPEQSGLQGGGQAPRPGQPLNRKAYDPATEKRGPQNWYEDAKGPPAEVLPNQDVGPKLPPGGWRGTSNAGTPVKSTAGFPDILVAPGSKPRSPATGTRSPPRSQAGGLSVQDHAQMQRDMLPSI